jgi:UDP-glucose 4-epimerase
VNSLPIQTVLITGAQGYVGKQITARLGRATSAGGAPYRVIATDIQDRWSAPAHPGPENLFYYRKWDIRNPGLSALLREFSVNTVVHLASIVKSTGHAGREFEYSVDVTGSENVIQACVEAGVKKLICSSSGAAYGYHPDQPSWLQETDPVRGNYEFPYSYHKRLVEERLAEARLRHPELKQVVLRIGTVLGETVNNQITDLFLKPRLLRLGTADSPFVFIWDQDLIEIFMRAVQNEPLEGVFNVAGDGALGMSEIAKRLNKPVVTLPVPLVKTALWILKKLHLTQYGPEQTRFLQYRPVLSNQKLKSVFGYHPTKTSAEAFDFWARSRGLMP